MCCVSIEELDALITGSCCSCIKCCFSLEKTGDTDLLGEVGARIVLLLFLFFKIRLPKLKMTQKFIRIQLWNNLVFLISALSLLPEVPCDCCIQEICPPIAPNACDRFCLNPSKRSKGQCYTSLSNIIYIYNFLGRLHCF